MHPITVAAGRRTKSWATSALTGLRLSCRPSDRLPFRKWQNPKMFRASLVSLRQARVGGCAASTKSAGKRSLLGAPTIYLRGPAIAVTPSGPEDERQTRDAAWEKASGPDLGC